MTFSFHKAYLIADDKTYIALKYVESMLFNGTDEDQLAAILRGDLYISVKTVSGTAYKVLVSDQIPLANQAFSTSVEVSMFASSIFSKWMDMLSK